MAEQEKAFVVTPSMKAAREKLDNMTPEEREEARNSMREELRRYYSGRLSPEILRAIESIGLVEE